MRTKLIGAGLAALMIGFSVQAEARTLRQTEGQVVDILKDLTSPRAQNPIFRCYHLGRLKGVHDRLSGQIAQAHAQSKSVKKAEHLHFKIQQPLRTWGYDCDRDVNMTAPMTRTLADEIDRSIKRIRSVGAEEPVIECFQAGRLKVLTASYREKLRRKNSLKGPLSDEELARLSEANRVVRAKSMGCDRF